jgi:putative membrane protein
LDWEQARANAFGVVTGLARISMRIRRSLRSRGLRDRRRSVNPGPSGRGVWCDFERPYTFSHGNETEKEVIMNWKPMAFSAAAGLVLFALPTNAQNAQTDRDPMILLFIHQADQNEIEMAKLAKDNSSSQKVKNFADQIIKDHKSADEQVQTYAKNHKIDLDALHRRLSEKDQDQIELDRRARAVGSATGEWAWTWEHAVRSESGHKTALDNLRKLKGAEFDREFTRAMVEDHQMAIDRLSSARSTTGDPELRNLIDKLLPTFKQHLGMAQKLRDLVSKA